MTPIGSRHAVCVNRLNRLLMVAAGDRAVVQIQSPVELDERSEPQPDVALLHPPIDRYLAHHALPPDIFLLVEVPDTTLAFDRDTKAPAYGRAGVAETWVVDLEHEAVLVLRQPGPDGYDERHRARRGDRLEVQALPGVVVAVDDVLGPATP